jgi:hypothetical protein
MTFNIGHQNAVNINNAAHDLTVNGGQQGHTITHQDARAAAQHLHAALERPGSPESTDALPLARDIDIEMSRRHPDQSRVGELLTALSEMIATGVGWARAGAAIIEPIRILATWLGAHGATILGLLATLA